MLLLLSALGCTTETLGEGPLHSDHPVAVDDASVFGFSAVDVVSFVGDRSYADAAILVYDNDAVVASSESLTQSGPFTLSDFVMSAAFVRTTTVPPVEGGVESTSLWIEGALRVRSEDGAFDTQGPMMLDATALSDDGIAWGRNTDLEGTTGTVAPWVSAAVAERWEHTLCSNLDNGVVADDAFVAVAPNGPVGQPNLYVDATWTRPYADCNVSTTVAGVQLSNPESAVLR